MMAGFYPGLLFDERAEKKRAEATERAEQSRAERKARYEKPKGSNTPPGWKPYRRPSEDEVDQEILHKTKKGI